MDWIFKFLKPPKRFLDWFNRQSEIIRALCILPLGLIYLPIPMVLSVLVVGATATLCIILGPGIAVGFFLYTYAFDRFLKEDYRGPGMLILMLMFTVLWVCVLFDIDLGP